ncbi:MAG TPA: type VI secretion system amidase effector protein Tae4 [Oligella sp.]|nr:type VI secretion system amidase effector protein Tae4 [Oligella sp.]
MGSKINFQKAWFAANYIFQPLEDSGRRVAEVIGGRVAYNINEVDELYRWKNTCAVRLSYVLNESGLKVPAIPTKTVSGSNGSQYFFRVRDLKDFLIANLGNPEVISGDVRNPTQLKGRKGIVLFDISGWSDASGHASLFDGASCYDACYFAHPQATYQTNSIFFWELE